VLPPATESGSIALLADIEADNPTGDIFIISDNLSSHNSLETRTWLEGHPRIHHVFIPTGARLCSICKRAGGDSSDAMPLPGKALPIHPRSSKPHASRRLNSIGAPNLGSGDGLARITAALADSFVTAFEELSTSEAFSFSARRRLLVE
jgi:hypothetical protein